MVVLDEDPVEERAAMVRAAAGAHRGLLQRPHPRCRLARVEELRPGAGESFRVAPGERGDPAQALEEVERGALRGE